jgi:hypothetical protein
MSSVNFGPVNDAEQLVHNVFAQLEQEADPQIAQLHYENQLRRFVAEAKNPQLLRRNRQPALRPAFKLLAALSALFLLASAANMEIPGWDDGQQITLAVPGGFAESDYNHYVALFANRSNSLAAHGGHSLIVDYVREGGAENMLQLSILGVDVTTANTWVREVLAAEPELKGAQYAITQPQVSYAVSVKEMLAFELGGRAESVERRVLRAWTLLGQAPSSEGVIYLIAGDGSPRRASMLR